MCRKEGTLISFTTTLGRKMLRMAKLRVNIVEKKWSKLLLPSFKLKCANTWSKTHGKEEGSFIWVVWNKAMAVNLWRVKTNGLINQGCLLCGNGKESIKHPLHQPSTLVFQCNGNIFASKVPRHLHQNLISININVMEMKMRMLTCLSISILVGKERDEIVIRIKNSY